MILLCDENMAHVILLYIKQGIIILLFKLKIKKGGKYFVSGCSIILTIGIYHLLVLSSIKIIGSFSLCKNIFHCSTLVSNMHLLSSLEEAIEVGRRTGVAVHISHIKARGIRNWGKHTAALKLIENAHKEGLDVTCDQYPYNSTMTFLAPCIPNWYFTDGMEKVIELLKDPSQREKIRKEMEDPDTDYENLLLNAGDWSRIRICNSPNVPQAEGMTMSDYAKSVNKDPFEAYFDMMIENKGLGTAVYHYSHRPHRKLSFQEEKERRAPGSRTQLLS